jgi:hypothetical protein
MIAIQVRQGVRKGDAGFLRTLALPWIAGGLRNCCLA